ncbi:MAG: hypothetical protein JNL38_26660 [Myxococcales bacterium]|jgi:hypothetical protein|nr:hypothetical protein [Myxococcales bacterium]
MSKRAVVVALLSVVCLVAGACKSDDDRGTCVNKRLKTCSVNSPRYHCPPGEAFQAGEASGPGVARCASLGFVNPMNSASDAKGQSHRLDVPVGSGAQNVRHALDEGWEVTYSDASYPTFR